MIKLFLGLMAVCFLLVSGGSALDPDWYKDQVVDDGGSASVGSGSLNQLVGKTIDYIEDETGSCRTCVVRKALGTYGDGMIFCEFDGGEGMGPRWVMMGSIRSFAVYDSTTPDGIENVPGFSAVFAAVAVLGAVLVFGRRRM